MKISEVCYAKCKIAADKHGKTVDELLEYYDDILPEYAAKLRRILNGEADHSEPQEEAADFEKTQP